MKSLLQRTWPSLILGVVLLITGAVFARACFLRNEIDFLVEYAPAHWIIYPSPGSLKKHQAVPLDTEFRRCLTLPSVPTEAWLRVRAFRNCSIRLNGRLVPVESVGDCWKQESVVNVANFLRAGRNELAVTVANHSGPPALWLAMSCNETVLVTDSSWEASLVGASWRPAALASDPMPFSNFDRNGVSERVITSCAKVWPMWAAFASASLACLLICQFWLCRVSTSPAALAWRRMWGMRILILTISSLWLILFFHNSPYLSVLQGFDARGHLDHISHIQETWSLPLADQGWEMYHPPLYYALAALLLTLGGCTVETGGILLIRSLNLFLALGNIFVILACLRLLFPDHPRRQVLGLIFAAFLPMHLYLYQYPTNEVMAATLATTAIYFVLRIVCVPNAGAWTYLFAGLALGAGLLTKISVIVLVPPVGVAVAAKLWTDRRQMRRGLSQFSGPDGNCIANTTLSPRKWGCPPCGALFRIVLLGTAALSVCGWHYVRVYRHFGTPLISNTDPEILRPWWQDPGYRMRSAYCRFGESLQTPLLSVWYSVGDGIYSTLWGDADCGGVASLRTRPLWAYDFMAAGYLLALLPTVAILAAVIAALFQFLRKPTIAWTFLLALVFVTASFVLYVTLKIANYSAVKAFYGLPAAVPLCAFAAVGLDRLAGPWRWLRVAVFALVGVWAANAYVSYWIVPDAPTTRCSIVAGLLANGRVSEARDRLDSLLAEKPQDTPTRLLLSGLCVRAGRNDSARELLAIQPGQPDSAARHALLGMIFSREQREDDSRHEYRIATELDPDDFDAAYNYAVLCCRKGSSAAIPACREALRIDPNAVGVHATLARLYLDAGEKELARRHEDYASRLAPKK